MTAKKENVSRIINRHMARLLSQLAEINAPSLIIQAVKGALLWLHKDIQEELSK